MDTKYLDNEIELLNSIKRNYEISDYGQAKLNEFKAIKQALTLTDVSNRRELLKVLSKRIAKTYELNEAGVLKNMEDELKNL